jgi:hypothetical protein
MKTRKKMITKFIFILFIGINLSLSFVWSVECDKIVMSYANQNEFERAIVISTDRSFLNVVRQYFIFDYHSPGMVKLSPIFKNLEFEKFLETMKRIDWQESKDIVFNMIEKLVAIDLATAQVEDLYCMDQSLLKRFFNDIENESLALFHFREADEITNSQILTQTRPDLLTQIAKDTYSLWGDTVLEMGIDMKETPKATITGVFYQGDKPFALAVMIIGSGEFCENYGEEQCPIVEVSELSHFTLEGKRLTYGEADID